MAQYKTPGVYIQEKNAFPNSMVAVATAIPVFIGYTEKAEINEKSLTQVPTRIHSLVEFMDYFGGAPEYQFELTEEANTNATEDVLHNFITIDGKTYVLHQVSEKYTLYNALRFFYGNGGATCYICSVGNYKSKLDKDALIDGIFHLEQDLESAMLVIPEAVNLNKTDCVSVQNAMLEHCSKMQNKFGILDMYDGYKQRSEANDIITDFRKTLTTTGRDYGAVYYPWLNTTIMARSEIKDSYLSPESLALVQNKPEHDYVLDCIQKQLNLLPPASAMAGIYTMVDDTRGVWKAPANVSMSYVVSTHVHITDSDQEDLNMPIHGEAVNAIRAFSGHGILVWGARTLDGNSTDWRYINVRRTVIMLEQSIQTALQAFVFEPNDASTWTTINAMIDNFLINLWKQGALVGSTPNDAFYVSVGLGKTMTGNDILEGILRVNVMVAITRPAEFIDLTFEQQMEH